MPTNLPATFQRPAVVPLPASRPELGVRKVGNVTVLDLSGTLTSDQPAHFRERIRELSDSGTKSFAINLAQVPYMDSSGVGALLAAFKSIRAAGGKCKFFGAPPQVVHTLERVNLHKVFELFEDEGAALSSF